MKSFIFESSILRSALLILLALLIGLGVAYTTFAIFENRETKLAKEDITEAELVINDDTFTGKFRYDRPGKWISGIYYEIEDDKLYITVLGTESEKKARKTDKDGYAVLTISELPEVKEVYYRTKSKDESLTVDWS